MIDRSDNTEIGHDQTQTGNTTDVSFHGSLLGRPNQLSVGFDVNRASFQHTNNTYTGSSGPVDPYNPVPGYYSSSVPFIPRYQNKAEQYALFAEDRLELTDRWSVVAGTRFDHADLSRQDLVAGNQAFKRSYSNTGWRLGSVYKLSPQLSLYAQASKAADPVSGLLMLSAANSAFDVSSGKQFEVGIKQSFWDGKGDWTLAAYSIIKNNLLTRDPANPALRIQVAWGLYSLLGKGATDPIGVTAGNFLRTVPLSLLMLVMVQGQASWSTAGLMYALCSGMLTSGLGYVAWYAALPQLKAGAAASIQLSVPLLAAIGAVSLLGEPWTMRLTLAGAAILGGISLVVVTRSGGRPAVAKE